MKCKAKRYDKGGSVMDKPVQDMRDPEYRKELERKQALETSTPEFDLMGAGAILRKAAARAATKDAIAERTGKSLKDIRDTTSSRDEFLRERMRERAKTYEEARRKDDLRQAMHQAGKDVLESAGNAIGTAAIGELSNDFVKSQLKKEREREEKAQASRKNKDGTPYGVVEKYKKGGAVSASKRADGIAKRGKTRGRLV